MCIRDRNNNREVNQTETVPCGTDTNTENKHPQLKSETRLPKYDSQSGTTIDSNTRPNKEIPNY